MLVGDHGRVIPFRHFKSLTIGVCIVLILSLVALILLGLMYTQQRRQIAFLEKSLAETRAQTSKLRDEKDLYLTQLIAQQKQTGELSQNQPDGKQPQKEDAQTESNDHERQNPIEVQSAPVEVKKEAPVQNEAPQTQWSADIRNFEVTYDNRQQILKAEFRIYNTSRPKQTLAGRTVVVFKASDDPPIQWATVPAVPLRDGKPVGNNGKSFRVNNYRTETFKTLRRKNSAEYDTASIYIFTHQGELIANRELPFKVDYRPPEPVQPPPSVPEQPKPPAVPEVRPTGQPDSEAIKTADPAAPKSGHSNAELPAVGTPPVAPVTTPGPALQSDIKPQEPQGILDDDRRLTPTKTDSTPQTPAAEPKPALEGGNK